MHANLGRDIPLLLGAIALMIAVFRSATDRCVITPDDENPQWLCQAVFYFVGSVLIGFAIVGHYSPY